MIIKIALFFLIVVVSYGVTVFASPEKASQIDALLWISGFSEKIRWSKEALDTTVTDIPTLDEFKDGAIGAKEKFVDGVDTTKSTIDSVRGGAQKIEDQYNNAKSTYDSAKNTFDDAKDSLNEFGERIDQVQWAVESVQNITNSNQE